MQFKTAADIAEMLDAHLVGDPTCPIGPDVVIDSRAVTPGALFVAITGDRHDAHDFVPAAIEAGAAGVLVARRLDVSVPQLIVADTVTGLSQLARGVVAEARSAGTTCLALTGSSGKTSTKDLLAQVLADAGETVAPPGSLNNEIGVPLTCCRVAENTKYLVSEMGARGIGHISWLTSIAPPDIAVVLNVGVAHLGEFGDVEVTARAKGELVEAVSPDGWAILNADDARVAAMAERTQARIGYFAVDARPRVNAPLVVTALDVVLDDLARPSFTLRIEHQDTVVEERVALQLTGRHQVANAAAAAAAAIAAGLQPSAVAASLGRATALSAWRMAVTERSDGVTIINDAYNANPDSMASAIATMHHLLASQRVAHPGVRGIAILGDMLELGDGAALAHRTVGASLRVDEVIAVGAFASETVAGAASVGVRGRVLPKDEIASALDLRPGDLVLLKASRGIGLETVARQLAEGAKS